MLQHPFARPWSSLPVNFRILFGGFVLLLVSDRRNTEATSSFSSSSSSTGSSCPKPCFCNALSKIVYCSRRGMPAIPDGIATDTLQLNLNGNAFQLGTVSRANFSRYANLEHLYLSECNIEVLDVDTFADLSNLKWLDLSNNRIRVLMQYTFRGLTLDHLFLNGNRNIQLLSGSFDGLITAGLYLQDCSLKTLKPDVLESLNETLRNLWLNGNELEKLDKSFGGMFYNLQHLHLGSNPLHCGCEAVWLKEFYDKNGEVFKTSSQPSCFAPIRLKGKYFNELSLFDFRCQSPVFSNIDIMFNDSTGRLKCSASGDPTPTLFWIQPTGKTTKYPPPALEESSNRRNEAVLVLHPGSQGSQPPEANGMTGMYICVANNEAGNVTLAVNVSWPIGRTTSNHLLPPSSMSSSSSSSTGVVGTPPRIDETIVLSEDQERRVNTSGQMLLLLPPGDDRVALGVTSVYLSGENGEAEVDGRDGGGSSGHSPPSSSHISPRPGAIAVQRMFSITELMCAIVVTHLCTLMASLLFIGVFYYRRRNKLSQQQQLLPPVDVYHRSFHGLVHKPPADNDDTLYRSHGGTSLCHKALNTGSRLSK